MTLRFVAIVVVGWFSIRHRFIFIEALRSQEPDGVDPTLTFWIDKYGNGQDGNGFGSGKEDGIGYAYGAATSDNATQSGNRALGNVGLPQRKLYSCGALTPGPVVYHGGQVLNNVSVNPIFWGNVENQTQIAAFYKGITKSKYIAWLSECKH